MKMHVTNSTSAYCVNHIAKDISTPGGFVVEFLITMMLVWTVCGIWDVRNATRMDSVPVKLGLIIAGLAMAAVCIFLVYIVDKTKPPSVILDTVLVGQHESCKKSGTGSYWS